MKRLLITGATGFVGRHCLTRLIKRKAFEVHAVTSQKIDKNLGDVQWYQVDLLEHEQLHKLVSHVKATHLLHLAWYLVPGKCWQSLENIRWVQASLDLLQAFINNGGQRAVYTGTCAEYDWRYGYLSEEVTPLNPDSLYGVCKHSLQRLVEEVGKRTTLSTAWARIFFLYGPHENPTRLVSSVVRALLLGQKAFCSHGSQVRDYLYVQDVADALLKLLDCDVQGPVNIASGNPIKIKKIVKKIEKKLNGEDLVQMGALSTGEDEPAFLVGDTTRLKDLLGWQAEISLDQGLDKTITWWRNKLFTSEGVEQ